VSPPASGGRACPMTSLRFVAPGALGAPVRQPRGASAFERLASGLRIVRAADDAAGLGVAVNLEADTRGARAAWRGMGRALRVLDIAEAALSGQVDRLQRMRELAVRAASQTLAGDARGSLEDELRQLRAEVDRAARLEAGSGQRLLDGSFSSSGLGAREVILDGDARSSVLIDLQAADAAALGLGGTGVTLNPGALGIRGMTLDGFAAAPGVITIRAVDIAATGAAVRGAGAVSAPLSAGGALALRVNDQTASVSFDGEEAAVLRAALAPASPLEVGGTLELDVDGVADSVAVAASTGAAVLGATAAMPPGEDGTLSVVVDGQTRTVAVLGVSAAEVTGAAAHDLPLAEGGALDLRVNGAAVSVSLNGSSSAALSGGVVSGPIESGGVLQVVVDGVSRSITVDGGDAATVVGSATPSGALPSTGSLVFSVDGVQRAVSVDGSTPPTVAGAAYSGQLTASGALQVVVNGTSASVSVQSGSAASLTGSAAAPSVFASGGTLSVTVDGVSATRAVTGSTAAVMTGVFGNNGRVNGSGGALQLKINGTACAINIAVNDTGPVVASKINAVIGSAGTAAYTSGTRTLTLTTAAVGAGASIEVVGTTGGLPINELGLTAGAVATGTHGDSVAAVLADLTAQLGGAGSFSLVGGAARLQSHTVGASSQVTVGAGTTAALATQLGLSPGQTDSGSDGDTVASIASALQAALGGAATVSAAGDTLQITATASSAASTITIGAGSAAGVLSQLGLGAGGTAGSDGDTLADVVAKMNAAMGGAGVASVDAGRLRLTSATIGGASSVEIGAASTAGVLSALGLSGGQADAGADGDTLAEVAAALQAAVGGAAAVSVSGGQLQIETTAVGSGASLAIGASSGAALLAELGLSAGASDAGTDGDDLTAVLSAIHAALGAQGTATGAGGRLVLRSAVDGATSEITVLNTSTAGVLSALGLSAGQSDLGADGDTLAAVAARLDAALGGLGDATVVGGALEVRSGSVGAGSAVQISASSTASALAALGLTAGASDVGADGDTLADVAAAISAQAGAAGAATVSSGRLEVRTTDTGADAAVTVGAGSSAALLAALGWTGGQQATGADGDDLAAILSKINAAVAGEGSAAIGGGGELVLASGELGAGSRVQVLSGSTASVLTALGLSAGLSDQGTDAGLLITGSHADGSSSSVVVATGADTVTFTGALEGLRLSKSPTATTAAQISASITVASADELSVATVARARSAMGTLDAALAQVSAQLAEIGALQNRLTAGQELALRAGTGFEAARSQIQDADCTALARDAVLQQTRTESGIRALRLVHRLKQEAVASLLG